MHPFIFGQYTEHKREIASEVANLYDYVSNQHASAGLHDTRELLMNNKIILPTLFSQGQTTMKLSMVWYSAFLGEDHPIVEQHKLFIDTWDLNEATYELARPVSAH